jgi:hypothetical protein
MPKPEKNKPTRLPDNYCAIHDIYDCPFAHGKR